MKKKRLIFILQTAACLAAGCAGALSFFFLAAWILPVNRSHLKMEAAVSWRIYDRNGQLIREAAGKEGLRSQPLPLDKIPDTVIQATLAIEDRQFYSHRGVNNPSLLRAVYQNFSSGRKVSGASTITMQLARLLTGLPRNLFGKAAQIWVAIRLERIFSKEEILELYLNRVFYGEGSVGIESASQRFFSKPARFLTLSEAALLAGLPQAPSLLNPANQPDKAEKRRIQVLKALEESGYHDLKELKRAMLHPPALKLSSPAVSSGHFSDYVLQFNPEPGRVRTSLDQPMNSAIQNIITLHVEHYENKGLTNASAVLLDNATGEIRIMVGSRDWNDPREGAVNGVLAHRQPGSALKPFAYELALEKGIPPTVVLPDVETEYYGNDRTLYLPQNYTQTFRGPVIFQEALALSLNVPAIRLIQEKVGLDPFLERLRALGFSGLKKDKDYYGLGLVLGNGEVSPLELAAAYSTLARSGLYLKPTPFPAEETPAGTRIMDENASGLITAILSDENLRIQAFGLTNPLLFGFPLAVKTGTSNQWRDTWAAAYNRSFTLVVWAGNFNADPMDGLSGAMGAGTLLNKIIRYLKTEMPDSFQMPDPPSKLKEIQVCDWSGMKPGPYCSRVIQIHSLELPPDKICTVHQQIMIDSETGKTATDITPRQQRKRLVVSIMPPVYDQWMHDKGFMRPPEQSIQKDTGLEIRKPSEGDKYLIEPGYDLETQTIEFQVYSDTRPEKMEWILNDILIGTSRWPYQLNWKMKKGKHSLKVRAAGIESRPVHFEVK
jgi:penicillin-binding protein 1C